MQKIFNLRNTRRVVASLYLVLFAFAFIDFSSTFSPKFLSALLYLQFTPSILKFINIGGVIALGFVIVIVLTLLFGRVYCSVLCPLGILQDITARVRFKNPKYMFLKPWNYIRYTTLAFVFITALTGSLFLLNMLDPYSFSGRIFSDLIRPLYYGFNNVGVKILGYFNSYALHHVEFKGMPWQGVIITLTMVIALFLTAWRWGRIFCNSFCPVGAFLSIISRYSIFKLVIDESACTSCNRCSRDCKASCIDVKNKEIDFSRCVACYNCIGSCKENGIGYGLAFSKRKEGEAVVESGSRRGFISNFVGIVVGATAIGQSIKLFAQSPNFEAIDTTKLKSKAGMKPNRRKAPITPPGSNNQTDYLNSCTACHLCVTVCPTHVIQPSIREFGFFGILQPHMDMHSGFCNFECTLCGDVCPTGAIRPLELETKKRVQLGKVRFHKGNCIVKVDRTECGACSEHCPTKAVYMVEWQGLLLPEVNEDICIGCGACEYACPTVPFKAIYVNGNIEHQVADLPENIDDGPKKWDADEFPF
jgi:polyferredoxin